MRFAWALSLFRGCGSSSASPDAGPIDAAASDAAADVAVDDANASTDAARDAGPPLHVLFIGNSYTYVNI